MQIYVHSHDTRLSGLLPHILQAVIHHPLCPQHKQVSHPQPHRLDVAINYNLRVVAVTVISIEVVFAVLVSIYWLVRVYKEFA